jgi:hypothetical protein
MMRVLVGDTEDIRSSRDGSGGLETDMLERLSSTSELCRHVMPLQRTRVYTAYTCSTMVCTLPPLFLLSLLIEYIRNLLFVSSLLKHP